MIRLSYRKDDYHLERLLKYPYPQSGYDREFYKSDHSLRSVYNDDSGMVGFASYDYQSGVSSYFPYDKFGLKFYFTI